MNKAAIAYANVGTRAFELAGVTAVFVLIGLWLDSRFGTTPVCTIVFGVLAWVGLVLRTVFVYRHEMTEHEKEKPWTRLQK